MNNSAQVSLASLVYALQGSADVSICEENFESDGHKFAAGSLIIGRVEASRLKPWLQQFDLAAVSIARPPSVKVHSAATPRIAFMHTWLDTQTEGWWRLAFDKLHVPFAYISTQTVSREADLRSKYDVIVFAPGAGESVQQIVDGLPMWGNPLPWQTSSLTPNLGKLDSTEDLRPGLGEAGVAHLKDFVQQGGLLITSEDTAEFAIDEGMAPGVFVAPRKTLKVVGSVLNSAVVDNKHPVAYGYDGAVPLYSADGLAFTVSNLTVNRDILTAKEYKRPTGRGGPEEEDIPEGRPAEKAPPLPAPKAWQATPLNEEQERNNPFLIPARIPAPSHSALRGDEGPAFVRSARKWRSPGRASGGRCGPLRQGRCAALRQQPCLPRGDHRLLRAGFQRPHQLWSPEVASVARPPKSGVAPTLPSMSATVKNPAQATVRRRGQSGQIPNDRGLHPPAHYRLLTLKSWLDSLSSISVKIVQVMPR